MRYSYMISYLSDENKDVKLFKRANIQYPHRIKTEKDLTKIETNLVYQDKDCVFAHIISWNLINIRFQWKTALKNLRKTNETLF